MDRSSRTNRNRTRQPQFIIGSAEGARLSAPLTKEGVRWVAQAVRGFKPPASLYHRVMASENPGILPDFLPLPTAEDAHKHRQTCQSLGCSAMDGVVADSDVAAVDD